jgi:hypothetical protein
MSNLSDKLPALSGVISLIRQQTNDIYYAGLWNSQFLDGLLWRLEDPELDVYVFSPKKPLRPSIWRAPSWSYAAVEGVVRYDTLTTNHSIQYCAELLECVVESAGENPFGELKSGFAKIRAPVTGVVEIGVLPTETIFQSSKSGAVLFTNPEAGTYCRFKFLHGDILGKVYFDFGVLKDCLALMVTPESGLIIVGNNTAGYTRVGIFEVLSFYADKSQLSAENLPAPVCITLL